MALPTVAGASSHQAADSFGAFSDFAHFGLALVSQ
jgi:hypothetical protein